MAKNGFFNYPQPNHPKGEISIGIEDLYLTRFTPPWSRPSTLPANVWRAWVLQQPVAMVCRETLIASLLALDWQITPRNSKYREELEPTIRHYTKLLVDGGNYPQLGLDYAGLVEWIAADLLDTPFGGAAEIGRKGNSPDGRVVWIRPLDAGTLYPTLNGDYPVVQMYLAYDAVAFRSHEISRTFMSPHSFLLKEGWGMAPPEKIYFALELLNRGDKYYANLLLDVPTAGILDLGDMEKDAAQEWATAFKSFVQDETVAFRVPVLYEHNNKIEYIPFGKVPNDIMFNQITLKYAALVAAAYGMSLSDIGLQTTSASGETLAGSIRQERRTKRTGHARMKAKVKSFFDRILPDQIEFNFIDYDDELNVALGRARLASSQSFLTFKDMGTFSPQEIRTTAIHDGLFPKSFPNEIPPDAKPTLPADRTIRYVGEKSNDKPKDGGNKEPELVGDKVAPSAGGEGEVRSLDSVSFKPNVRILNNVISKIVKEVEPKLFGVMSRTSEDELEIMRSVVAESFFSEEDELSINKMVSNLMTKKSVGTLSIDDLADLESEISISDRVDLLENINFSLSEFLGKAILFTLNDAVFSERVVEQDTDTRYNYFVKQVQGKIAKSLPDYVKAHVGMEVEKLIQKMKEEN